MGYQSEAQLEQLLIQRLKAQDFNEVKIDTYDKLMENFKENSQQIQNLIWKFILSRILKVKLKASFIPLLGVV